MKTKDKQLQKERARLELKKDLLKLIYNFKSKEEPDYQIKSDDVINVLSSMIERQTS